MVQYLCHTPAELCHILAGARKPSDLAHRGTHNLEKLGEFFKIEAFEKSGDKRQQQKWKTWYVNKFTFEDGPQTQPWFVQNSNCNCNSNHQASTTVAVVYNSSTISSVIVILIWMKNEPPLMSFSSTTPLGSSSRSSGGGVHPQPQPQATTYGSYILLQ